MNHSGTYVHMPGYGIVKVSSDVPRLAPSCFVPKGDVKHYDRSALRTFYSKAEKRVWMKQWGLKEGGIVQPGKRWEGVSKNTRKPTAAQRQERTQMKAWVASQGGTQGLLKRVQTMNKGG